MSEGSTLIAFTDGLVERRGEHLDLGLARLADAASHGRGDLDTLLTTIVTDLTDDRAEDDVAVLAFRWVPVPTDTPRGRTPAGQRPTEVSGAAPSRSRDEQLAEPTT